MSYQVPMNSVVKAVMKSSSDVADSRARPALQRGRVDTMDRK